MAETGSNLPRSPSSIQHAFILTKLVPQKSAHWTSPYGHDKAADLPTSTFLALRVLASDIFQVSSGGSHSILFPICTTKPKGLFQDRYVLVASDRNDSGNARQLPVKPTLSTSDSRPLYVHTAPMLFERNYRASGDGHWPSKYRATDLDLQNFIQFALQDHRETRKLCEKSRIQRVHQGDYEIVRDDWETWSGQSSPELLNRDNTMVFEFFLGEEDHTWDGLSPITREIAPFLQ